jgi:hypothetical protein
MRFPSKFQCLFSVFLCIPVPAFSGPIGILDRKNVLVALGQIGGVEVVFPLMEALTDEDEGTRKLAEEILETVNGSP